MFKKNQLVVVQAPVEQVELVQYISLECFNRGAKDVIVRYIDETIQHMRYAHKPLEDFQTYPEYEALFYNESAKEGAAYLILIGEDPDLMNDIDPNKISSFSRAKNQATPEYRNGRNQMRNAWCIGAVANKKWAEKVYPYAKNPVEELWKAIFSVSRVMGNPIQNWQEHKDSFLKKMDILNHLEIESLHYTNSIGTDFICEMNEAALFVGGGSTLVNGNYYFPNIPTEELFSAPKRNGCHGKLVASMPLCFNGSVIEDFWFEFKDGKVIDFGAKKGKDVLESILHIDENASYLGEVALVPYDSPISNLHTIFYETLLDENASCHFALGASYGECLKGGLEMSEDELLTNNMNVSLTHVDFMVGTKDLKIVARCKNGQEVDIFVNGNFSSLFD